MQNVLSYSPIVVLEGPPAVGKSYFVRSNQLNSQFRFYAEDKIELWATESVDLHIMKILFIDEINLKNTNCSYARDLFNRTPSIYIKNKYYLLTSNCKIMFAQNPLDFGGDRHEPRLFTDLNDCKIIFRQMSPAFILHRILKPIFSTTFDAIEALQRATHIINMHFSTMRSIRDLQTKAIFECTLNKYSIESNILPGAKINDFILTTSRMPHYTNILTLLQARLFKHSLPHSACDGAKFNGVNGLILQGPPGSGKSDFIVSILKSEDYVEMTDAPNQKEIKHINLKGAVASTKSPSWTDSETYFAACFAHGRGNTISEKNQKNTDLNQRMSNSYYDPTAFASLKYYYRLRASISVEQKINILKLAFDQGAIVLIDEIDSCSLLEHYLNAYLTGEDLNGNRAITLGIE